MVQSTFDNSNAVLPDGIFSTQKSHFGQFLERLAMEDVGNFIAILLILHAHKWYIYGH
jgi:hypothetical protein